MTHAVMDKRDGRYLFVGSKAACVRYIRDHGLRDIAVIVEYIE